MVRQIRPLWTTRSKAGRRLSQGVRDYEPPHRDRQIRLGELMTGDGRRLPARLRAELERDIARLEQCLAQLSQVESERDALVAEVASCDPDAAPATLLRLRGIGPELASLLWLEARFRRFGNRRQLAAHARLTPSPWQSGGTEREQGIEKSGNPRLRRAMIEPRVVLVRHQPGSALSRWFVERVGAARGRVRRTV
ncbi:transposase [Methylobacterium sp. P31]